MNNPPAAASGRGHTVAYIMSRFPKLTETFVLDEIVQLNRDGCKVEIFPLWREPAKLMHEDARRWVQAAQFLPGLSWEIIADNYFWLSEKPRRYFTALWSLLRYNISSPRFLAGALAAFPKASTMARRMQQQRVAHLHAHFASHPAAIAYVVNQLTDIPWSFTAHGSDLHREQAMLGEKVRTAKFTVAISQYNKRFILQHCAAEHADKLKVVHCGVDLLNFATVKQVNSAPQSDGDSLPTNLADDVTRIVCIGTLHEVKGQAFLIRACAQLSSKNWQCHLVGDGEDRGKLESLASSLGVRDQVIFHGQCTRDQVREVLSQMNIACAPSVPTADGRREGIPVALMEAAAACLPLVASDLSGIPELVEDGETGLLTPIRDVAGIAAAITRLVDDPLLRARLSQAARKKIELEFSLANNVATLQDLMFKAVT